MKIDIHVHTKQCKNGDAPTREVSPKRFCEIVLSTDVKILAITNHNTFDLGQFVEIKSGLGRSAQIWPGIELDVVDNGVRGHLLLIVSPDMAETFSAVVAAITKESNPNSFTIRVEEVLQGFDAFGPLYVAHYQQKKPDISEIALEKLMSKTAHPSRVIKEVTNSISAGIYISHGYPSIYGSDVHNWEEYEVLSHDLPDLRLPVESFEHFCLLLEKDPTTINTLLERKTSDNLVLRPFDDDTEIKIKAYNDINVIFGPKGTGKSCLLKAISRYYSEKGVDAKVYISASDRLDEIYDTKGKDLTINLESYTINYCTDEIANIKNARESDVTSLRNYTAFFNTTITNRKAIKILLKDMSQEEESGPKRDFIEYNKSASTIQDFLKFLESDGPIRKELIGDELAALTKTLTSILGRLGDGKWRTFSHWKEVRFLNSAIESCRREVARKTGSPINPSTTGFREYAKNRVEIEANAIEILTNIDKPINGKTELVGNLGQNKGNLHFCTEVKIQSGDITDSTFACIKGVKKGAQKKFVNAIRKIKEHAYKDDLFQCIADLNEIDDVDDIKTINELLLFKRYFSVNEDEYSPSSGEASMVMLQRELGIDKDVYILDEPERSLGNEYINDVIVPLIKDKARAGKRVFISTHDANIAVRTLPYSSIYRCHGSTGYGTYVGNPFSNHLINLQSEDDKLDWKKVSMKTLEGGEEAFGERGKIYGNN